MGFRAFRNGQKANAQTLMRGRVLAQAFTVAAMTFGAFYGFKPTDRPISMEDKMDRQKL